MPRMCGAPLRAVLNAAELHHAAGPAARPPARGIAICNDTLFANGVGIGVVRSIKWPGEPDIQTRRLHHEDVIALWWPHEGEVIITYLPFSGRRLPDCPGGNLTPRDHLPESPRPTLVEQLRDLEAQRAELVRKAFAAGELEPCATGAVGGAVCHRGGIGCPRAHARDPQALRRVEPHR